MVQVAHHRLRRHDTGGDPHRLMPRHYLPMRRASACSSDRSPCPSPILPSGRSPGFTPLHEWTSHRTRPPPTAWPKARWTSLLCAMSTSARHRAGIRIQSPESWRRSASASISTIATRGWSDISISGTQPAPSSRTLASLRARRDPRIPSDRHHLDSVYSCPCAGPELVERARSGDPADQLGTHRQPRGSQLALFEIGAPACGRAG